MRTLMLILFLFLSVSLTYAQDCSKCHSDILKKKAVHPAIQMGCEACHTGLDTTTVPHKSTNSNTKGLMAEGNELCFSCHDKTKFSHKTIHPAVEIGCIACHDPHSSNEEKLIMAPVPELCYNCHEKEIFTKTNKHPALEFGCTACHNPHSTDTEKLLLKDVPELCFNCHDNKIFQGSVVHVPVQAGLCTTCHNPHSSNSKKLLMAPVPELCFNCHDKRQFTKKNIHPPVKAGKCLTCHNPHASENIKLLVARPILVCLRCHGYVRKTPHAITAFSTAGGHPIGQLRKPRGKKKPIMDPLRPGREFYCGSCHNPHSSDWIRLFRYKANSALELCQYCHKEFF